MKNKVQLRRGRKVHINYDSDDLILGNSYKGEATILHLSADLHPPKHEIHWDVKLPNGEEATFPVSCIYLQGPVSEL